MSAALLRRLPLVAILTLATGACAGNPLTTVLNRPSPEPETLEQAMERARERVPSSPDLVQPSTVQGTEIWRNALQSRGLRVMVSTETRSLWLMRDTTVIFRAPVAVGMEDGFTWEGREFDFTTPVGRRRVLAKATDPLWVPPDWHYFEVALERDLEIVRLRNGQRVVLGDSTRIEVRGKDVGRVNQFGNFWAFTPGSEIIFDGKVYIPPFGTRQRQIPEILGTHKLELGDGYLIHGTNQATSIGDAVSHGCVRMYNADVAYLYDEVPVGTAVFIF
jgi:hypothetical protein